MNKFEGHTPGDWQFTFENFNRIVIRNSDRDPIAQIYMDGWGKKTAKANAKLLAAAPTLLAENAALHQEVERLREALQSLLFYVVGKIPNSDRFRMGLLYEDTLGGGWYTGFHGDSLVDFMDEPIETARAALAKQDKPQ